jgi:hypothetical protein
MTNKSEGVKRWRRKTKQRSVDAFGGKCGICGYKKCNDALQFHHINPKEKEFEIGQTRATSKSWIKIVKELKKCVCVCANCHKEIHKGVTLIPENINRYDEFYTYYKEREKLELFDECPICGKSKHKYNVTCSLSCAAKRATKGRYPEDVHILVEQVNKYGYCGTGRIYDVSDNAIRKYIRNHTKV